MIKRFLDGKGNAKVRMLHNARCMCELRIDEGALEQIEYFKSRSSFVAASTGSDDPTTEVDLDVTRCVGELPEQVSFKKVAEAAFLGVFDDPDLEKAAYTFEELRCAYYIRDFLGLGLRAVAVAAARDWGEQCSEVVVAYLIHPSSGKDDTKTLKSLARAMAYEGGQFCFVSLVDKSFAIHRNRPKPSRRPSSPPALCLVTHACEDVVYEEFGSFDFSPESNFRLTNRTLLQISAISSGWCFHLVYQPAIRANVQNALQIVDHDPQLPLPAFNHFPAANLFHGLDSGSHSFRCLSGEAGAFDDLMSVREVLDVYSTCISRRALELDKTDRSRSLIDRVLQELAKLQDMASHRLRWYHDALPTLSDDDLTPRIEHN